MKIKLYHYPKCSTCSSTLQFLRAKNLNPEIFLYCENGIQKTELTSLMRLLSTEKAQDLVKKNGILYRTMKLDHQNFNNDEWLDVIIRNPKLLQRPIVVINNKAIVAKNTQILEDFIGCINE